MSAVFRGVSPRVMLLGGCYAEANPLKHLGIFSCGASLGSFLSMSLLLIITSFLESYLWTTTKLPPAFPCTSCKCCWSLDGAIAGTDPPWDPPQDSGLPKRLNKAKPMGLVECSAFLQLEPCSGLTQRPSVDVCGVKFRSESLGGDRDSSLEFGLG